ncbi:MAG TPA: iron chaperone [Acholeplasmataceae bacterium]|nr:iron chaperone [Acholeplasmataceae bacterium]
MEKFKEFLDKIDDINHRKKLEEVLEWIIKTFPNLETRLAWNQPMFTNNGTFIIGFSVAKNHFAVAPEGVTIEKFAPKIKEAGYGFSKMLFRIRWDEEVNYELLKDIIIFNIEDKKDHKKFWR